MGKFIATHVGHVPGATPGTPRNNEEKDVEKVQACKMRVGSAMQDNQRSRAELHAKVVENNNDWERGWIAAVWCDRTLSYQQGAVCSRYAASRQSVGSR